MTFRHLEAFIAVARAGSVTLAAEALFLTQPTVSIQLKELEEELGVALFDRAGRGVTLTEAGERLLARAAGVLEAREHLLSDADGYRGLLTGTLEVHASNIPGDHLLPPLLGRFKKAHPGLRVACRVADSAEVIERISSGAALLGVVGTGGNGKGLLFRKLWKDTLNLYAPGGLTRSKKITLDELASLELVVREAGSASLAAVERALVDAGVVKSRGGGLNVVAELGSTAAVREALLAGVGAAFISDVAVRLEVEAGRLERIEVEGFAPVTRHFHLVTDPARTLPPAYEEFARLLLEDAAVKMG